MRCVVRVQPPVPLYLAEKHAGFGDYDFGVFRWIYQGDVEGAIEAIDSMVWMTEPQYPQPVALKIWMAPNVFYTYECAVILRSDLPSVRVANQLFNPATGEGVPFQLP